MQFKPLLIWLMAGAVAAVAVGWVAAQIYASGHAPIGIVSLGVGGSLGVALGWLAAAAGVRCRRRLVVGTLLLGTVTVLAEHAWLYRDFCKQWQESREQSATVAMFRSETPPSPVEYITQNWNPALWISDAAIIVVAAVGVVLVGRHSGSRNSNP